MKPNHAFSQGFRCGIHEGSDELACEDAIEEDSYAATYRAAGSIMNRDIVQIWRTGYRLGYERGLCLRARTGAFP